MNNNEKLVIETLKVTYKIEDYEDKRIIKVKACKNKEIAVKEETED